MDESGSAIEAIIPEEKPAAAREGLEWQVPQETLNRWEKGSVDYSLLKSFLAEAGYILESPRELLSIGAMGPVFILDTDKGKVVEKTFIHGGAKKRGEGTLGRRMTRIKASELEKNPVRYRMGVSDSSLEESDVIVDWVYNEEMALKELECLVGVPKLIRAVYDGLKGSVIEEYIDGYELVRMPEFASNVVEIHNAVHSVLKTYTEAIARGYLYNNLVGSSILVESSTGEPHLVDWYNHTLLREENENAHIISEEKKALGEFENRLVAEFETKHRIASFG
jgi:hypothetical protein